MITWETKSGCRITRVLAGRSNVFLSAKGGENILIDSGPGSRWKTLDRRLRRLGVERLAALVLTHAHYDHAGNAARLQDKYEAKVIAHIVEGPFLVRGENNAVGGTNALTRLVVAGLGKRFARWARYEPCRPDIQVDPSFDLREFGLKPLPSSTAPAIAWVREWRRKSCTCRWPRTGWHGWRRRHLVPRSSNNMIRKMTSAWRSMIVAVRATAAQLP